MRRPSAGSPLARHSARPTPGTRGQAALRVARAKRSEAATDHGDLCSLRRRVREAERSLLATAPAAVAARFRGVIGPYERVAAELGVQDAILRVRDFWARSPEDGFVTLYGDDQVTA